MNSENFPGVIPPDPRPGLGKCKGGNPSDILELIVRSETASTYRVVQKRDTQFNFWDNSGISAPILTILSLLQAKIYGA